MSKASESPRLLAPAAVHILLALADGDRHGYGVRQEVERLTGGAIRLGPGTLYEAIQRLEQAGLIVETAGGGAADQAPRAAQRRYYRLTPAGLRALRSELDRLDRVLAYARSRPRLKRVRS